MPDKQSKLHKYFRKPDDPRYSRLDTLADELEKAGVPRGITILAFYPMVAIVFAVAVAVVLAALWGVWENIASPLLTEIDRGLLSPLLKRLGLFGIFLLFLAICVVVGVIKGFMEKRKMKEGKGTQGSKQQH